MTVRALLVDIDGVLVVSWQALPGAIDALERLRSGGMPMRFLTNTTSRTRLGITDGLRSAGFTVDPDEILTATSATAAYLSRHHPGARCLLLNSGDVTSDLPGTALVAADAPPGDVDVVVVGGAGPEFTYDALNHALACVLEGAVLVAMHRNLLWRTDRGLQLDTGAFVMALERASRRDAVVIGKPAPAMFEGAIAQLGVRAEDTAMVGDDVDSDVRAAQTLGLTGVLVRTGKYRVEDVRGGMPPDVVVDSFADVPAWLETGARA